MVRVRTAACRTSRNTSSTVVSWLVLVSLASIRIQVLHPQPWIGLPDPAGRWLAAGFAWRSAAARHLNLGCVNADVVPMSPWPRLASAGVLFATIVLTPFSAALAQTPETEAGNEGLWWAPMALVVIVIVAIAVIYITRRRRRRGPSLADRLPPAPPERASPTPAPEPSVEKPAGEPSSEMLALLKTPADSRRHVGGDIGADPWA